MRSNTYRKHKKPGIPINGKQRTIIKMAQGQLGISDGDYRDMLDDRYKVRSCTKLTYDQASEFIRELEGKGFTLIPNKKAPAVSKPKRPTIPRGGKVVAIVSQDELDKIDAVAALVQWRVANGLELFLEKRMGIKKGKVRTSEQAYLAIEGLKKLFENQMKAEHGAAWWTMNFQPRIMEYVELHCPEEYRQRRTTGLRLVK